MTSTPDSRASDAESARARFRRAFDAHFDAVNRYCLRRIPVDDVNDVVADVFVVAWRKIHDMPGEPETLPWLYRVAQHEVLNSRRSSRRFAGLRARIASQPVPVDTGPEPEIVRNAELDAVAAALESLAAKDREVLMLRTHEELTFPEIAIVLGCSPEAARKRSDRALRRLRKVAQLVDAPDAPSAPRAIEEGGAQ